jgi:large subunit ribosomal protein L24
MSKLKKDNNKIKTLIRKNDTVVVLSGRDRDKKGKVLQVLPFSGKVIVEGLNFVHRHTRPTQDNQQGGIVQKEAPITISNVNIHCGSCDKAVRTGVNVLEDGTKVRICRKCKETV